MEWAAVAANVECGALDQRTQLGERDFAARDDALRKGIAEHRPGTIDDAHTDRWNLWADAAGTLGSLA